MFEMTEISGGISRRAARGLGLDAVLLGDQRRGIEFELAELAGERHVLRVGHRLFAKPQHQMVEPGGANRVAILGAERLADIDAADFGAEAGFERDDFDAHGNYSAASRASTPKSLIETRQ